ncbi:4Fe-4S binding protein [Thermococcus sp. LS2]|uniref:4Fe-4S binding protein n=1 Tax=Thermococcus sp. LS2 TaxID=1638260 RepID=UPI00143C3097|nr:4Fe-4S binding protein [Thermococcus sp. LS2]NJE13160.1 4Fe-4S dicluster domain-containing protein [Thermococcus sp. LS2]
MTRYVVAQAKVDEEKCTGCTICERVCPTLSIKVGEDRKAHVDIETCVGCGACFDRCPFDAITLVMLEQPKVIGVKVEGLSEEEYQKVKELCKKARIHPEQVVCFCTGTRAEEIAAAILFHGAKTPEYVSRLTGARTGCKTECIQPILRLLEAAGYKPEPPKGGWQWYGRTATVWEIPQDLFENPEYAKYRFKEDKALLEKLLADDP